MPTGHPLVSIVVVVRDAADELAATLASIAASEAAALRLVETVVIDGASTDGTSGVARASDVADIVVSEPDGGIYDAMNKGARIAHGDWLHFLNAGDLLATPHALSRIVTGLQRAQEQGRSWLVGGAVHLGGPNDGRPIASVPHRWWRHAYGLQPHCHQATWFRRDLFLALGGHSLQHSFVGDFDLILRFGAAGAPAQEPDVLIRYLAGGLSAQRAAEVPALLRQVRRERLALSGPARLVDDAAGAAVAALARTRRVGWWLNAAVRYVPKRIARSAASRRFVTDGGAG